MEAKDILFFGLLGLGAVWIMKSGYKPKMISTSEGWKLIPILPSFAPIEKEKEEEPAPSPITYNITMPEPSPIVFTPPAPAPTPSKSDFEPISKSEPSPIFVKKKKKKDIWDKKIVVSSTGEQYIEFHGVKIPKKEFLKRPEWFGGQEAKRYAETIKGAEKHIWEMAQKVKPISKKEKRKTFEEQFTMSNIPFNPFG